MAKRAKARYSQSAQQDDSNRTRNIVYAALVVAGIIALGALLFLSVSGPRPIRDAVVFGRQTRGHDDAVTYNLSLPPVGGTHHTIFQNCGIYLEPIETQYAIHSMEHGAIWIAYNPDTVSDGEIAELAEIAQNERFTLLAPYPNLDGDIVLTGWGVQLVMDSPDGRVQRFIDLYLGQGPERGAACSGGIGTPE